MSYEEEDTCMSYEEEDSCTWAIIPPKASNLKFQNGMLTTSSCSAAEIKKIKSDAVDLPDACHMRRRIHACHMRRRIHACHMRRRIHACHFNTQMP
jgi:hypothetical protein